MQYESKYLKYKLKYLKLCLSLQKGGVAEQIKWPEDLEKIKEGDELKVISYGTFVSTTEESDYDTRLKSLLDTKPICKVYSVLPESILLGFTKDNKDSTLAEVRFTLEKFKDGLVFEKVSPDIEKTNINENVLPYDPNKTQAIPYDPNKIQAIPYDPNKTQAVPYDPNKIQAIPYDPNKTQAVPYDPNKTQAIPYDPNKTQAIPYDQTENKIKNLEKQIAEIEKRLNNHYHILPTSGMKDFEESHPYYNKKLD